MKTEKPGNNKGNSEDNNKELYFAVVGGIGTDFKRIEGSLRCELEQFGYDLEEIRISKLLGEQEEEDEYIRINSYIEHCNQYRENSTDNGIFAKLAINEIIAKR